MSLLDAYTPQPARPGTCEVCYGNGVVTVREAHYGGTVAVERPCPNGCEGPTTLFI